MRAVNTTVTKSQQQNVHMGQDKSDLCFPDFRRLTHLTLRADRVPLYVMPHASTNVGGTRLGKPPPLTVQPPPTRRPHTGGGETAVNANGRAALPKWKSLEVDSYPLKLTALYPATNYMVGGPKGCAVSSRSGG